MDRRWSVLLFLGTAVAGACGGKTAATDASSHDAGGSGSSSGVASSSASSSGANSSSGSGVSDAGNDDAEGPSPWDASSDAPWSPVCPTELPTTNSACTTANIECEYGDAWWNPSCNQVVKCYNGNWIVANAGSGSCLPAPGPNAAACSPELRHSAAVELVPAAGSPVLLRPGTKLCLR